MRLSNLETIRIVLTLLAVSLSVSLGFPQATQSPQDSPTEAPSAISGAPAAAPAALPQESAMRRYRLEIGSYDNSVSNGFGHWWGGGLSLAGQWKRLSLSGQAISQSRPGEVAQLYGMQTRILWADQFFTDFAVSGGGPNDPAAFFPRLRYDASINVKIPGLTGFIFNGGLTRLYFGNPTNGRIRRGGIVYYWRRFVFQGNVFFNNVRPGNRKSKSGNGVVQYGQEGRYWIGLIGGGGREAWQTLALTPQDTEFTSYSGSVFLRKWLSPAYGIAASYGYMVKRGGYRIHSTEFKFFFDF
jgi:YaiO family outer membrane protein